MSHFRAEFLDLPLDAFHLISREYGSSSCMKVIGLKSRSQEPERSHSIKLLSEVTPVLYKIQLFSLHEHRAFSCGGSNGVTAVVVT